MIADRPALIAVIAACGAATKPAPAPAPARTGEPVAPAPVAMPPRDPWAARIVIGDKATLRLVVGGAESPVRDASELRAALDKLALPAPAGSAWPATSVCSGAAATAAASKLAVAPEPPQAGDLAIVVGENESFGSVLSVVRAIQRPTALVVHRGGGERVLRVRLCPDTGAPAFELPSTVEVTTTGDLPMFFVASSGGIREQALVPHPWGDGVAPLVHAISEFGAGARARVWINGVAPMSSLVLALDALAASHAQLVEIDAADLDVQILGGTIRDVQPASLNDALATHASDLVECYEHALFVNPAGPPSPKLALAIHAGHAALASVEPAVDDTTRACLARVLDAVPVAGLHGDKATFVLSLARIGDKANSLRRQHPPRRR